MKKFLNLGAILIICILFFEILLNFIFYSPLRMYYPLGKEKRDIQTDFDVVYNVNLRTGNRVIKCNNNNSQNRKVVFIGDSFVFGQGLKEEDTFVNLYACKTGYNVKNLAAPGIGIEFYNKIALNYDFKNVELVYLIFYDNDLDIKREENNFLTKIKSILRHKSFTYLILRKLKNHILYGYIRGDNLITYKGSWNNPSNVFRADPYELKNFEINEYKKSYIEKEILKIVMHIKRNSDAKLITMVIPEPSVVSAKHVNFYKSVGARYFLKFLEISDLAKFINFLSKKYDFEYLPLYENFVEIYTKKNAEYYFNTDFHLNNKGSAKVFNYIISTSAN